MKNLSDLQMPTSRQDVTDLINSTLEINQETEPTNHIGEIVHYEHQGQIRIGTFNETGQLTRMLSIFGEVEGKGFLITPTGSRGYWTGS